MCATTTTDHGVPILHMWGVKAPVEGAPDLGFPLLSGARHTVIFQPTGEEGGYNHHSKIILHDGFFSAMWSNHPRGEDGPGQRVLWARSSDAEHWSEVEELFPEPTEVKDSELTGLALTAMKWVEIGARLYAVVGLHDNVGFTTTSGEGFSETWQGEFRRRKRLGYGRLAREVYEDGSYGPIFSLTGEIPSDIAFDVRTDDEAADDVHAAVTNPFHSPAWDFQSRWTFPDGVFGNKLCEPTVYRAGDGRLVCLQRDLEHSHRLFASFSDDEGRTWPPAQPTDIPDSPSLSTAVMLDDGRVLLIGNQVATRFDVPDDPRHYRRSPLTVAVSRDGYLFERAFALNNARHQCRIEGVKGRGNNAGAQYPSAIVEDGVLYCIYSLCKEDVGLTRVAIAELGR